MKKILWLWIINRIVIREGELEGNAAFSIIINKYNVLMGWENIDFFVSCFVNFTFAYATIG
jgi:hypothetical protein